MLFSYLCVTCSSATFIFGCLTSLVSQCFFRHTKTPLLKSHKISFSNNSNHVAIKKNGSLFHNIEIANITRLIFFKLVKRPKREDTNYHVSYLIVLMQLCGNQKVKDAFITFLSLIVTSNDNDNDNDNDNVSKEFSIYINSEVPFWHLFILKFLRLKHVTCF